MDDEAHIGLVNTHAEGNGSHDDIDILHQEIILCLRTGSRIQTGMIGRSLDIVGLQHGSQFFHLFPGKTVDNTALIWMLLDKPDDILVNVLRLGTYLVIEVRTIEGTLELRSIDDAQIFLDITAHFIRRRCRQGYDGGLSYLVHDGTDTTVLWSEVVPPL